MVLVLHRTHGGDTQVRNDSGSRRKEEIEANNRHSEGTNTPLQLTRDLFRLGFSPCPLGSDTLLSKNKCKIRPN